MAAPDELVVPPPTLKMLDYPVSVGLIVMAVALTAILVISSKFDKTNGALTISLIVILCFTGTVTYCLLYTVPQDQSTAAIIGGLVASFGAVVAYWLKPKDPQ